MAAAAPQSQSQPLSAEEEALKRNTDCVYFLASPLTCKKGSECDYRHSEIARVNPRDCWYWLHGNCLNPKCAFRHPPLDGLLGTQAPTSAGPSAPASQNVPTPTPHVPNASTKPGVPCVFFQKGHCMKGDWCQFLHIPNSLNNKPSPLPATASAAQPANIKKAASATGLIKDSKPIQDNRVVIPVNVAKPVKDSKPILKVDPAPPRNDFSTNRRVPQTSSAISDFNPRYRNASSNGNPISWSSRGHLLEEPESMHSRDVEEVSREPSPGFDVLVDDDGRDSDYYPGEDRYGQETRNEYDLGHSSDYKTIASIDDERYQDPIGYDSHDHRKGQYGWEQHRASSERMAGGSYLERRPYSRPDSRGQVDELDLRHRLSKNKKPTNGLRSVISHDHGSYHGSRRDEHQNISLHDNSLSSRLRGRIRMPGRSSSPNERDMIRSRISPIRSSISSGRIREQIKGRVEETGFSNGGRNNNHRGLISRRDAVIDNNPNFAAPKSLAELKTRKNGEPSSRQFVNDHHQSLGKRKHLMHDGNQPNESDLSFEGPKPLKEILKRKKGETVGTTSVGNNSSQEEEGKDATKNETIPPSKEAEVEETKVEEAEEGMIMEDGVDQEYEQKEGESDYEQVGGEDYELYDGENGDAEGEYIDEEDDDDDFAKKMGVMYS